MIISASRRTDIPAYYAKWFFNRLEAGYVLTRNPVNPHQISRVSLRPDVVDAIVFWTKNPLPMLDALPLLHDYMYYFQFTLTAYGPDVEPQIPDKDACLIPAFQRLAQTIGPDRVVWRYDPIFLSEVYTPAYHLRRFAEFAARLHPYTRKCTISFLDQYRNTAKNMAGLRLRAFPPAEQWALAKELVQIAHRYGLEMDTCAEELELAPYGVQHARCIDDRLLTRLLHCPLAITKDKNQRLACGCVESIDIGAYHTCPGGCRYCYANDGPGAALCNAAAHDPSSPLLFGAPGPDDRITEREMRSYRVDQLQFDL